MVRATKVRVPTSDRQLVLQMGRVLKRCINALSLRPENADLAADCRAVMKRADRRLKEVEEGVEIEDEEVDAIH